MSEYAIEMRNQLVGLFGIVERNVYLTKRYFLWDIAFMVWTIANTLTIVFIARSPGVPIDQQNTLAGQQAAFNLRAASKALRLLAHVLHRQMHAVGDESRERNARRLDDDELDLNLRVDGPQLRRHRLRLPPRQRAPARGGAQHRHELRGRTGRAGLPRADRRGSCRRRPWR